MAMATTTALEKAVAVAIKNQKSKIKNQKSKAKIHKPRLDQGFQPMQPRNPLAAKLYDISKRIFRKNT
jgi:hypothetical protein